MGKMKLLYDVIMTMKGKESFMGNFKVEGSKDQIKIFDMNNDFEKNLAKGQMKAKVSFETDCAGKKVKHESNTEFDMTGFLDCDGHGFMHRGFFHQWHDHHEHHPHPHHVRPDGMRCCGIKGKLSKLALLASMLNSMKMEAQEDKSTLLSLGFEDLPGDMKTLLQEKLQQHRMHHAHCFNGRLKEFSGLEIGNARLSIRINKNNEVEKFLFNVEGKLKDESGVLHPLILQAELNLTW
jgi:hypothetical protein